MAHGQIEPLPFRQFAMARFGDKWSSGPSRLKRPLGVPSGWNAARSKAQRHFEPRARINSAARQHRARFHPTAMGGGRFGPIDVDKIRDKCEVRLNFPASDKR